jgi:DNA-binding NtrC family response regulator
LLFRFRAPHHHGALQQHNGSQTEAAAILHVPLSTLNRKIKRLDIKPKKSE